MPLREAVGIILNLLTWNEIKWSVKKNRQKTFCKVLFQYERENKMENCYNANECKKMNVLFCLSLRYQLRDMKNSWNIPRVKIKQKTLRCIKTCFKRVLEHFLNFYFHLTIWLCSFCITIKLQHDKKDMFGLLSIHIDVEFCTPRSIFRLRSTQDET